MKGILGKNKWIAVLLCITMLLCISPLSPLVAFGEDGDAGVSDSVEGDAGDVSTEDGSMDGDTTGDNGQSTDGVTDGEETSDGEETTEGTGDGTEETPDGAENQPADGEQQEGTEGNQPADGEQEEEITDENVPKTAGRPLQGSQLFTADHGLVDKFHWITSLKDPPDLPGSFCFDSDCPE